MSLKSNYNVYCKEKIEPFLALRNITLAFVNFTRAYFASFCANELLSFCQIFKFCFDFLAKLGKNVGVVFLPTSLYDKLLTVNIHPPPPILYVEPSLRTKIRLGICKISHKCEFPVTGVIKRSNCEERAIKDAKSSLLTKTRTFELC